MSSDSPLRFEEALAEVLAGAGPLSSERVPLRDALGRALASDVVSPVDLPPWDNASMDGYAVRADDVRGASAGRTATLRVVGEIVAGGDADSAVLSAGDAVRISTGAPVPPTADAVVRVEDTDRGATTVRVVDDRDVCGATPLQRNVRPRGEDVRAGSVVLAAGTTIGPAQLGVLASVGAARVDVVRRPRIALVSSGDELVDVDAFDEVLGRRRIVSSNAYTLAAQSRVAGAEPLDYGATRDDLDALRERLAVAIGAGCEVLVTSGGISVGAHDHTRSALAALGMTLGFWRVRMRPGGPFGFGTLRDADGRLVRWLGIPGNPVSAMVTFELFGRPLLRRLGGHARVHRRRVAVRVADTVRTAAPLTHFLRASLDVDAGGRLVARLTGAQGSNLLTSMARADVLLVVPHDVRELPAGSTAQAIVLSDGAFDAATP